ncbi:MAG: thiamine pyrophosphate-dependent dehydrogenase E1 component subunit alpha [Azospirillaceae bacterium]|nr:thiamine pyrophosphate-dependent dehydrogenase E1 component subunit alpha [Azospirillaceae bacterium]
MDGGEGLDLTRAFQDLLRVRLTEETLASRYKEQEMRTPTHFGTGQEAVAVGVCQALAPADAVYSHHRSHNHYLARGGSVYRLAAEIYGREDGCSRGRGGSVHLTARDSGFIISSAILGQTVATAVGSALAFAMDGTDAVAVSFFGDATLEEGVFYESLNFAALHHLPVLLVCENNLYSTESPADVRQPPGSSLCGRVRSFGVTADQVDGNDVAAVFKAAAAARLRARAGGGPVFLECMTYRWREHVGPAFDHESGRTYRSKAELDLWLERCPVRRAAAHLVRTGQAGVDDVNTMADTTATHVAAEIERARAAPWPSPDSLFDHVWRATAGNVA